jgi:Putative peptidoglycan binding domain
VPRAIAIDDDFSGRRRPKRNEEPQRHFMLAMLLRSPKDTVAIFLATATVAAIIVNAMYLQSGRHPSPLFAPAVPFVSAAPQDVSPMPRPRPVEANAKPADAAKPAVTAAVINPKPIASSNMVAHSDPVGDLIATSRRITAVQRTLAEYGYAQLKPTGVMNAETQAAITKFERERKLPVTGQMSDRLLREIAQLSGRPIE